MKKRLFAIMMLILLTFLAGCSEVKQGKNLNEEQLVKEMREGNALSDFVKIYNKKYNKNLEASKIEVCSIKTYKKGYLLLTCYRKEVLELKLFYIEKDKDNLFSVREAKGQYLPKLSVNSLKDDKNTIYFGNLSAEDYTTTGKDENNKSVHGKVNLTLDTGIHVEENFNSKDKGYIIIVDSQGMVVDLTFTNVNNEPFNYIKEFVNYSHGIYETKWNAR